MILVFGMLSFFFFFFFGMLSFKPAFYSHLSPSSSDSLGFLGGSYGKESACNVGDPGSIPGLGRFP